MENLMAAPPTDSELSVLFARCERIGHLAETSRALLQALRAGDTALVAQLEASRRSLLPALGDGHDAATLIDAVRRGGVADSDAWWDRCTAVVRVVDNALEHRFDFLPGLAAEPAEVAALVDFLGAPQVAGPWDPERDVTVIFASEALEADVRALVMRLRARGQRRIVVLDPDGPGAAFGALEAPSTDALCTLLRELPPPAPQRLSFAIGRAPGADPEHGLAACRQAERAVHGTPPTAPLAVAVDRRPGTNAGQADALR
jgi:hypothetical protein